ncbi:MurR/RpiR family transcriptional regulator [Glaciihabitans sp. dw_435]|uniref:MurR/RpiR family transcriptional regulator n=1 Tax=Glaciihabitans sp. dw_435 TaxID=2720081 RepID=UPI001BD36441|nr:MurR/RpiR family transcriptional regulator [Glaciihabitans sp. dw_435]
MTTGPALAQRLDDAFADLSPQEKRAADFMRDHLADLAIYNLTEVARLSGVSKATISRLYRRLGFDGAESLRDHVRALRAAGNPVASDTAAPLGAHVERELANLRAAVSQPGTPAAAEAIAAARRVLVIGFRNSYPVALHLRQQLAQARDAVELAPLPGQSVGEELASLGPDDLVVLVGFRRRPESFARVVAAVAATGARTILLTDATGRRHAAGVEFLLECPVDSVSAFDSYAAASSLVSVLAAAVLGCRLRDGRERIATIGNTYAALDELESLS